MCRGFVGDDMARSGGWGEGALVVLVVVEADVADGLSVAGVGGDVVVVADGGDVLAGVAAADVDDDGAEAGVAVGGDGELVDGGVVLAGQVAGAAVCGGGVPGVLGGGADGGVDLPRTFRTAYLWLIHAADCRSRYSSRACRGVRY
jgi:hypothetical protein